MPIVTTDAGVQGQVNKAADLTAKKAGDLAACTVHLFTNNFVPDAGTVLGDFTEATFTGYVAKAVTAWNANELAADGSVSTDATNVMTWVGPGDGTGETIQGYYFRSAGVGTPYIQAVKFPAGVGLEAATDVLALVATFRLP